MSSIRAKSRERRDSEDIARYACFRGIRKERGTFERNKDYVAGRVSWGSKTVESPCLFILNDW